MSVVLGLGLVLSQFEEHFGTQTRIIDSHHGMDRTWRLSNAGEVWSQVENAVLFIENWKKTGLQIE